MAALPQTVIRPHWAGRSVLAKLVDAAEARRRDKAALDAAVIEVLLRPPGVTLIDALTAASASLSDLNVRRMLVVFADELHEEGFL